MTLRAGSVPSESMAISKAISSPGLAPTRLGVVSAISGLTGISTAAGSAGIIGTAAIEAR